MVELLPIPSGDFLMGSDNDLFSEAPVHAVSFRSGFLLGKCPITQAQWQAVMGDNPSAFRHSPDHPVDSISWDQAAEFCHRLGAQSGQRAAIPALLAAKESDHELDMHGHSASSCAAHALDDILGTNEIRIRLSERLCKMWEHPPDLERLKRIACETYADWSKSQVEQGAAADGGRDARFSEFNSSTRGRRC
jgi:hypothetical protein